MSYDAARRALQLGFSERDHQRMAELASKVRAGTLTTDERSEADAYERIGSLFGRVKSVARRKLQDAGG